MTDQQRTPAFVQKKTQDNIATLYGLNRRQRTPFSLPVAPAISTGSGSGGTIAIGRQPDPEIRPWIEHGIIGSITETIDLSMVGGNFHRIIMSGDIGIAFTNPPEFGFSQRFIIQFEQDGIGGHDVTSWPAALANPPTIDTAIGARTRVEFYVFDGGIVYHVLNTSSSSSSAGLTAPITLLKLDGDVTDSIGTNDGTVTGTATYVDGVIGQAFDFDGSSYITLANESNFDFERTDKFSLSCWFKTSASGSNMTLISKRGASNVAWQLFLRNGEHVDLFLSDGTNSLERYASGVTVNDDEWHNAVVTYDGTNTLSGITVYVDGVSVIGTTSGTPMTSTMISGESVTIGARPNATVPYTGLMDDVRIYDKVISASEVFNSWLDGLALGSSGSGGSSSSTYTVDRQGNKSGTVTFDIGGTTNKLQFTATADCDITLSNIPTGASDAKDFHIEVIQDSTGGHAITFNDSEVINPPTIGTAADTTSLLACTADGDGNIRIITLLNATPSNGNFASQALDNLVTPILNTPINFNSNAPTNFNGYTNLIGQTLVNSATGSAWTLPAGDTYEFFINGISQFAISAAGSAFANGSLNMTNQKITNVLSPTSDLDAANKKYVDDTLTSSAVFDDDKFIIQDEVDNTKTITFNASLLSASAAVLMSYASGASRTYTFPAATGTVPLLSNAQTWSAIQTHSTKITFDSNGSIDIGDSTHHANQVFSEQVTLRSISGPALSTTAYVTADSSNMIHNVPTGDEYDWKIDGTSHMRWTRDTNGRLFLRSGAAKEMGFVVSTSNVVVGTSGTVEIPVDGGSVGTAAGADTDFGDSVGCQGLYLNSGGNPTWVVKIDDSPNTWATMTIPSSGNVSAGRLT